MRTKDTVPRAHDNQKDNDEHDSPEPIQAHVGSRYLCVIHDPHEQRNEKSERDGADECANKLFHGGVPPAALQGGGHAPKPAILA